MTEDEWLSCENATHLLFGVVETLRKRWLPQRILEVRVACLEQPDSVPTAALRSWFVAATKILNARDFRALVDGRLDGVTETQASYAELWATPEGIDRIRMAASIDVFRMVDHGLIDHVHDYNENGYDDPYFRNLMKSYCPVVLEVFGNPFRPVAVDPAWRTSTVVALASGIYAERAFERLPILADALQDAGCDAEAVLAHFRDPAATHVRGCWAVDLCLGLV